MAEYIKKLIKIGKREDIEKLYKTGEIYCNTLKFFKDCEKPDARFDRLEGSTKINQYAELTIFSDEGDIVFSKNQEAGKVPLNKGFISYFNTNIAGNIFSCIAITDENEKDFFQKPYFSLDEEFKTFGDTALIIEDPAHFINSFRNETEKKCIENYYGLVEYYDSISESKELTVFNKESKYSWQHEFRFFMKNHIIQGEKYHIGSLEHCSQMINLVK